MSTFEKRNEHFDRLFSTKDLFWLGQNTNHIPMHPNVRQALLDSIESEEWHAYAPPLGFTALLRGIIDDLGLPSDSAAAHLPLYAAPIAGAAPISSPPIPAGNGPVCSPTTQGLKSARSRSTTRTPTTG